MDFESLKSQVSNLTLYDLKAGVRKVQNGEFQARIRGFAAHADYVDSGHELYGYGGEGKSWA